jgi:hypothetical protein
MGDQYQHYVQSAYLYRWKVTKYLYLIDKTTGTVSPKSAAKRIMGMKNMQTAAMETAFGKVEECIGHTAHQGEIMDTVSIRLLAEWMALHLVRNALNASSIGTADYVPLVKKRAADLANYHGRWMDFTGDVFITGDNPVVEIRDSHESFYIAALSPRRCVYLVWDDKIPWEHGQPGFMPPTINWYIYKAASRYCVSFDEHLHTEDLSSAIMPLDDREE